MYNILWCEVWSCILGVSTKTDSSDFGWALKWFCIFKPLTPCNIRGWTQFSFWGCHNIKVSNADIWKNWYISSLAQSKLPNKYWSFCNNVILKLFECLKHWWTSSLCPLLICMRVNYQTKQFYSGNLNLGVNVGEEAGAAGVTFLLWVTYKLGRTCQSGVSG